MSGENQYINPIIQSMMESARQKQNSEELKARTAQYTAENQLREQQLAQQESEFQRQHDLEERILNEVHIPQLQAALKANQLHSITSAMDLSRTGVGPSGIAAAVGGSVNPPAQLIPPSETSGTGVTIPSTISLPGGRELRTQDLPTPQSEAARIQSLAGAQAGGAAAAQFPYQSELENRRLANEKELADIRTKAQSALQSSLLASEDRRATLQRSTQMQIAQMDNATRLHLGNLQYNLSPDQGQGLITALFTGQAKPSLTNPIERRLISNAESQGFRLPANDIDNLRSLSALDPILDRFEEFSKMLPTSKLGAAGNAVTAGIPMKDLNVKFAEINSDLQKIGKGLEGFTGGRILSQQFKSEQGGIPTVGNTQAQALDKVNNLRNRVAQQKQAILNSFPNPAQRDLIAKTVGIDTSTQSNQPGKQYQHYAQDPETKHVIGSDDGKNWFDPLTGKPVGAQ